MCKELGSHYFILASKKLNRVKNQQLFRIRKRVMLAFPVLSFLWQNNMQRHLKTCGSGHEKPTTSEKGRRTKKRKPTIPKETAKEAGTSC
ncbi:hypothetical protein J1605_012910 [Eschrichtius robustus]|uniref:Uncharacterized protein n=1 Tax=Eschrichtius robustus TaxID=9764 RepID=A0AB34GKY5_ESCRO|nr:hypothetical protein J1605_012910 [Eschrichtius robustus]